MSKRPILPTLLGALAAVLGLIEFVAAFLRWGRIGSLDMNISGMGSVSVPGADAKSIESFTAMPGIVTAIVGLVAIGAGALAVVDRAPRLRGWILLLAGVAGTVHAAIAAADPERLLFDDSWRSAADGQAGSAATAQYGIYLALVVAVLLLVQGAAAVLPGLLRQYRPRRSAAG
ncbi:hypothetical protein [Jongsikchunia kroppenstedtii]|uniref:hypothetical protein n=1 Tax=Jongsikchunia kroppenstedtii TaxID=1121721 RepID=UPI0003732855|nr:hypothetical protein [Jongsikchunia kroppenstedtii]